MNIAIVDDQPSDAAHLQEILNDYSALHHIRFDISYFSSAEELLAVYQPLRFAILFLDIYLGGMMGTRAAEQIRLQDEDVLIIFLTTSDEHRAPAFDCFASGYLIKPAERADIFRTLDHILHVKTLEEKNRFFFITERQEKNLPYSEILALHSEKNYVILTELSGTTHKIRMRFSEAEELCQKDKRFLNISRGVIVNLDHVLAITRDVCQLRSELTYPINTRRSSQIRQMWYNYNFEKLRTGEPAGSFQD